MSESDDVNNQVCPRQSLPSKHIHPRLSVAAFLVVMWIALLVPTAIAQGAGLEAYLPTATPTIPATGMSVYSVTNPNAVLLSVQHTFTDGNGVVLFTFWADVP